MANKKKTQEAQYLFAREAEATDDETQIKRIFVNIVDITSPTLRNKIILRAQMKKIKT